MKTTIARMAVVLMISMLAAVNTISFAQVTDPNDSTQIRAIMEEYTNLVDVIRGGKERLIVHTKSGYEMFIRIDQVFNSKGVHKGDSYSVSFRKGKDNRTSISTSLRCLKSGSRVVNVNVPEHIKELLSPGNYKNGKYLTIKRNAFIMHEKDLSGYPDYFVQELDAINWLRYATKQLKLAYYGK